MTSVERTQHREGATSRSSVALAVGSCVVLIALLVVLWSGLTSASGRFAATTSNDSSLLSAAQIDLVVDSDERTAATGLLIDAEGLYPGLVVDRCIGVTYFGSIGSVDVRLSGRPDAGTGLERFILTTVETGTGSDPDCGDFVAAGAIFDGTLDVLWERHPSYERGIEVLSAAESGTSTWVRFALEVADDNDAQGLTTSFWLTVEARP